ncbi:hypothetical protein [Microbacterium laevaniformans]|uniref:hypothetical protein n=1 Tax=Microbacterium laevaniformans TaxID=36807 RepID=UPI003D967BA2
MIEAIAPTIDIHPEIPRPAWVTDRYEDDDGRLVVDEHEYEDNGFRITRSITHSAEGDAWVSGTESWLIQWDLVWPDGTGTDREEVTVVSRDIPGVIAVLQRIQMEAGK